jgi:EpsI family protein
MISWNARFTIVAILTAGTALFLQARPQFVPPRTKLASFPAQLGSWAGSDVPVPDETLQSLGPGEFLQRTYKDRLTAEPAVDLYLAYLPNYHEWNRHLPQDCMAASGWSREEWGTTSLSFPGDTAFTANRFVVSKGADRQLVLFWYAARGQRQAKDRTDFHLAIGSLLSSQSDNTLLVRMNTALLPGERPADAEKRLLSFASSANPTLNQDIPQ